MADIFISYANEDEDRIRPLVQALEAKGWSVFWDHRIPAGQTWRSYIGNALNTSRCVIVTWSQHSLASHWVAEEADVGKARNVLVPVLIEEVLPPMGFRSIQAADLTEWDGDEDAAQFNQLVSDLQALLDGPSSRSAGEPIPTDYHPSPPVKARKKRNTKKVLAYSLLSIAAVALIGYFIIQRSDNNKVRKVTTTTEANEVVDEADNKGSTNTAAGIRYFVGKWTNTDPNTRGITRLEFRSSGGAIWVHAWGSCSPQDCDWGEVRAEAFGQSISSNTAEAQELNAVFRTSFNVKTLEVKVDRNDRIKVDLKTRFTDNSGRSSFSREYNFKRAN